MREREGRPAAPQRRAARWERAAILPLGALAAILLLAGCGSGGRASPTPAQSPPPAVAVEASGTSFDAEQIFRAAAPSVVTIRSVFGGGGSLLGGGGGAAEGSGFVLDTKGEIVTNAHVVTNGGGGAGGTGPLQRAQAVYVQFPDQNQVPASIVGVDPFSDVALLKVNGSGLKLHALPLGNDSTLQVGQPVAALGSPFGEQQSLTTGIVSALKRSVQSLTRFQIEGAIQTDTPINPGNSGGPLLDAQGQVIGINEQIETRSGSNAGVGFAVPISAVQHALPQLAASGRVQYPYLGVSTEALYPQLAQHLGLSTSYGGLIARVVSGGPGDKAGLRGGNQTIRFEAQRIVAGGDVILAVNGKKIVTPSDVATDVAAFKPGDQITLQILRGNQQQSVKVTLGVRPGG